MSEKLRKDSTTLSKKKNRTSYWKQVLNEGQNSGYREMNYIKDISILDSWKISEDSPSTGKPETKRAATPKKRVKQKIAEWEQWDEHNALAVNVQIR